MFMDSSWAARMKLRCPSTWGFTSKNRWQLGRDVWSTWGSGIPASLSQGRGQIRKVEVTELRTERLLWARMLPRLTNRRRNTEERIPAHRRTFIQRRILNTITCRQNCTVQPSLMISSRPSQRVSPQWPVRFKRSLIRPRTPSRGSIGSSQKSTTTGAQKTFRQYLGKSDRRSYTNQGLNITSFETNKGVFEKWRRCKNTVPSSHIWIQMGQQRQIITLKSYNRIRKQMVKSMVVPIKCLQCPCRRGPWAWRSRFRTDFLPKLRNEERIAKR